MEETSSPSASRAPSAARRDVVTGGFWAMVILALTTASVRSL